MEAWAQRATGHKELGAGVVVAVRIHGIGEGVDVGEVAPPRLVVIQPALPCSKFQDALSWALPVPAGWTHGVIKESLGTDVIEEKGTLACANCHYVLVKTHWSDP